MQQVSCGACREMIPFSAEAVGICCACGAALEFKMKMVQTYSTKPLKTETRYFTFGQDHTTSFKLPKRSPTYAPASKPISMPLADFWVAVELLAEDKRSHRNVFVDRFTSKFCPSPMQFAFEYEYKALEPAFYSGGELLRIRGW